jgi:hypothetical protein
MVQLFLIGLSAGAAAALLFASVASGSPLSVVLFYVAPLPVLIAAAGWSHWAALIAAVVASASLAAAFGPYFFVTFLVGVGLPAWWLGYLAQLARPAPGTPDGLEWYPAGHLVFWAAVVSSAVVIAAMLKLGPDQDSFHSSLRSGLERLLSYQGISVTKGTAPPASETVTARFIELMVALLPPAAAVLTTLTNVANLWLADRIARISGRSRRPASDLSAMRLPPYAAALAAVAIAGSFLNSIIGLTSGVLASSLLLAYAIIGFAVMHAITRGTASRPFTLGGVYVAVLVFGWLVLVMSMLGLADAAFDFRGRIARKRNPPNPRT